MKPEMIDLKHQKLHKVVTASDGDISGVNIFSGADDFSGAESEQPPA